MGALLALLMMVVGTTHASECDPAALEERAYTGNLNDDEESCLDRSLIDPATSPEIRAQASFLLIVDNWITGKRDKAVSRMRKHLGEYHTRDPEVAYLYASYLRDLEAGGDGEELIRWAKVALDGRYRWLDKKRNYTTMVKSLYDMINEASMVTAIEAQKAYEIAPTQENKDLVSARQRRAKYWLILSGPCLHSNQCGPEFDVEIEGLATCNDIPEMESKAAKQGLNDDEISCLRGRYRRKEQRRIVDLMITSANRDVRGIQWKRLLAWHWQVSGQDDIVLAQNYAKFLARRGTEPDAASEALHYADIALSDTEKLKGKKDIYELYSLRAEQAQKLIAVAEQVHADTPDEDTFLEIQAAKARARAYTVDLQRYCDSGGYCPDK